MVPTQLPEPVIYHPDQGEPSLGWGIVGPGWIAGEFVTAVQKHTTQRVVGVASRSSERGQQFAADHGLDIVASSVDELAARPEVDVIYIASPPGPHLENGLAAVAAGKHVIIEKPFTATAAEATQLVEAARAAGLLAMEAMWSRYLPQASVIKKLLDDGAFGEIRMVFADHGQNIPVGPDHRLYRADLGGGALLDLGIYPMQFASMVLGAPRQVTAIGHMTQTGVDADATVVLRYDGSAQATLTTSMIARTPMTATIAGSDGSMFLDGPFYNPTTFTLHGAGNDGPSLTWTDPTDLRGFDALSWEATALARFVGEGRNESPVHTLDETVSIIATIDEARAQIGRTEPRP